MVADLIRDSTVGQLINWASGGQYLPYAEQQPGFEIPSHLLLPSKRPSAPTYDTSDNATICNDLEETPKCGLTPQTESKRESTIAVDPETQKTMDDSTGTLPNPYLVDWYGDDDPDNPMSGLFISLSRLGLT